MQTSQHKASDVAGSSGMQQQVSRTEIRQQLELQRQTDQQGDADKSAEKVTQIARQVVQGISR